MTAISPCSVFTQVARNPIFTTTPFTPLYSTESSSRRTPSESKRTPDMMFDNVFWSARDTASPTIPEIVRNENSDATPVRLRIATPANVIQTRVNPSRMLRASPACAPALLTSLLRPLIRASVNSADPTMIKAISTMRMIMGSITYGSSELLEYYYQRISDSTLSFHTDSINPN